MRFYFKNKTVIIAGGGNDSLFSILAKRTSQTV